LIKLIKGDCLEKLKTIPDKSVDLVLTDPPYDLENHGGGKGHFGNRKINKEKHIDFISNSFDMPTVFSEIKRVCRVANVVMFCSNKQISKIMGYWEKEKYSVTLLTWDKPNPVPFGNGKYISNLEFIVFVRDKGVTYNNISYADNLKSFKYPSPSSKQRIHPTEKPVEMLERLIKIHSNEKQVVLDMFMGSGSTGESCLNLNRSFIGIEKDEKYFELAKNRIQKHYLELKKKEGKNVL
jgi:site-specific DNA-methyltransferase (adenine-specific)